MSKPHIMRGRNHHTTTSRRRNYAIPELRLTTDVPEHPSPPPTHGEGDLLLLRAFAQEVGTTAAALRQQICRGELRLGIEVYKPNGRWYVDRQAFGRRVRRHARGAA